MLHRNRVKTLLDEEELEYETAKHAEAFTARGVAAASHLSSREVAKAVLVRDGGGRFLMAVVPASCRLDLKALARASCHRGLTLATEEEVARLFPDCEPGALPPFGNLYDIPTFLDACVCDVPEIHFSVIAYSHCIAHGYDMAFGVDQQKRAAESGVWPLYRFDPRRTAKGEPPLRLDSPPPRLDVVDYMRNEGRFRMVEKADPERFKTLARAAQREARQRYAVYQQLAGITIPRIGEDEKEPVSSGPSPAER